ncbi:hypothetical protein GWK47_012775 [Chionoecetes opilio]|uniref:Uncharacterized protein n=1 Tax=Chionoecetes opilio TaxID=41210 RepID=A0A8J5CP94_CHIOP|nr:hypothetical protein GWK47_012775 [Chionoecetes opilio]
MGQQVRWSSVEALRAPTAEGIPKLRQESRDPPMASVTSQEPLGRFDSRFGVPVGLWSRRDTQLHMPCSPFRQVAWRASGAMGQQVRWSSVEALRAPTAEGIPKVEVPKLGNLGPAPSRVMEFSDF